MNFLFLCCVFEVNRFSSRSQKNQRQQRQQFLACRIITVRSLSWWLVVRPALLQVVFCYLNCCDFPLSYHFTKWLVMVGHNLDLCSYVWDLFKPMWGWIFLSLETWLWIFWTMFELQHLVVCLKVNLRLRLRLARVSMWHGIYLIHIEVRLLLIVLYFGKIHIVWKLQEMSRFCAKQ